MPPGELATSHLARHSNTVSRALARSRGAIDGDEASVERMDERVGVGERQLRRLFRENIGA